MAILAQIRGHRLRFVKTLALYVAFIAVGMCSGIAGPTILDLQVQVKTTYDQITYILPGRAGGFAVGAFIAGLLYKYVNPLLLNVICLALSSVFMFAVPFNRTLIGLVMSFFGNGISMGMICVAANIFCLHLWGKENPPFMQALHMAFGIGGFFSPLAATPFLHPLPEDVPLRFVGNATKKQQAAMEHVEHLNASDPTIQSIFDYDNLDIQYCYYFVAAFIVGATLFFVYLYVYHRETAPHPSREKSEQALGSNRTLNAKVKLFVVCLSTVFMYFYVGLEIAMGTLLVSFAVKSDLRLDKVTGAAITSVYWGTFTFFRLVAVFYIEYVGSELNLYFSLSLIMLSNVFFLPLAFGINEAWLLWTAAALIGLGTSSVFASVFGFLEEYFPVTEKMTAAFSMAACLGEFILPFIMGHFVELHPSVFIWMTFISTIISWLVFLGMVYLCRRKLIIKDPSINEVELVAKC